MRVTNPEYTAFRSDNVGHVGEAPIEQEAHHPAWTSEDLRHKWNLGPDIPAQKLFHAISCLSFAESDDVRIDRNHQNLVTHVHRSPHRTLGCGTATGEIELIPDLAGRSSLHIFQSVTGDRRQDHSNPGLPRRAGSCDLTVRVHNPQISHGRQEQWHGQFPAEHMRPQVTRWYFDRVMRPKCNGFERPAIFAKRPLAFRPAIDVVEDNSWHAAARKFAEIVDVYGFRKAQGR